MINNICEGQGPHERNIILKHIYEYIDRCFVHRHIAATQTQADIYEYMRNSHE